MSGLFFSDVTTAWKTLRADGSSLREDGRVWYPLPQNGEPGAWKDVPGHGAYCCMTEGDRSALILGGLGEMLAQLEVESPTGILRDFLPRDALGVECYGRVCVIRAVRWEDAPDEAQRWGITVARAGDVVTVEQGDWCWAYAGSHVTVRQRGYCGAHSGSYVTVERDGTCYGYAGSHVIVKEGGWGFAHSGSHVTVWWGGECGAYHGSHVTVERGGYGWAYPGSYVTVERGGYDWAYPGSHVTVERGGYGVAITVPIMGPM